MGILEQEVHKRERMGHVQRVLLMAALVGVLVLIGAVPIGIPFGRRNKYRYKHQLKTALARLAQKGYVTFVEKGGKRYARITDTGKRKLAAEEMLKMLEIKQKKRWDRKWRAVIFDIPEYRRETRHQLRKAMQNAGFYRLQDSVWLYPYDCEDFIALLKADLKIGNAVLYMIVDKIENDGKLKEHFGIS